MTGQENERPDEVIEHGPVTLRRYRAEDVDVLFHAIVESLDHLRPWLPWVADYSRESAREFLARSVADWDSGTAYNYAIMAGGVLAGGIGLMARIGPGGLEVGHWVRREPAPRGPATPASAALGEHALPPPGVDPGGSGHDGAHVAGAGGP